MNIECRIIKVDGFEILELHRGEVFEYYVKEYEKVDYKYVFGVLDRFTEYQLRTLADSEYFDSIFEG